MAEILKKTSVM